MGRKGLWAAVATGLAFVGGQTGPAAADPLVTDTIIVGDSPFGVAVSPDGTRAYVTNQFDNSVSVIDTTSNPPDVLGVPIGVGTLPQGVAVSPDGTRAYVTNAGGDSVSVIDTTSNPPDVLGVPIGVGTNPFGVAVSPDGTRAYVTNAGGDSVSVIDTTSNPPAVLGAPIGGFFRPQGVAVSPDGTRAYVANSLGDWVSVIDTTANPPTVLGTPTVVGFAPNGVAVSPDGTRAYVTNQFDNSVSVIDTTSNPPAVLGARIGGLAGPQGVAVSPDGTRAYVTNQFGDSVSVIDTTSNPPAVLGAPIGVGTLPQDVAVSPDGTRAYVTNRGRTVSVLALQPSPPTAVTATAGDTQITASWTEPTFTGGPPITSYTATAFPGAQTCNTNGENTCDITGLTNGTSYLVTVRATNTIGTSEPSAPSNSVTPGPAFSASPDPVVFGEVTVGQTGGPQSVTVTNSGTSDLTVNDVAVAGTNPGQFSLGTETCTSGQVAPGDTCTVEVSFAPTSSGDQTATLAFASDAPTSPDSIDLSGTGVQPGLSAAPDPVVFGEITVGQTGGPQSVTVTNTGTSDLTVSATTVSGAGFAITGDTCTGTPMTAGGTCSVQVSFTPAAEGAASGQLSFTSNAPGSPHTVALTGTGTAAPAPPAVKKKQTLKTKLPKRIKIAGLTVITPKNARTNAGQLVRTIIIRGGPVKPTAAGQVRYFTVIRGPKGKVSIRTYGYPNLRLKVTQKAPATTDYKRFTRTATYLNGTQQ